MPQGMPNRVQIVILGLALLAFGPTLFSSFHFDDHSLFSDSVITSSSGWWEVFRLQRTRPLTYLTFWLNWQVGGEYPFGYHLVNLAIHLASVWVACSVFLRVADRKPALIAASIFAFHPLQTEPVAYIFARATLLAALLCLLCWKDWLNGKLWRSALFFGAALLAKEEAAAFPVFLFGYEWICRRRGLPELRVFLKPLSAMLAFAALAAARLYYAALVTKGAGIGFELGDITPARYLLTQGRVIWEYLRVVVWPASLNFDRDFSLSAPEDLSAWLAWGLLVGAIAASCWFARRQPKVFWLLGFFILLIPASSVVPLADLIAERRMYLPILSLSLAIGCLLKPAPRPVLMALAFALCGISLQRSLVWRTEESLWRDTTEKSPSKIRPKLQLARALAGGGPGKDEERLRLLHRAKNLAPNDRSVATELGVVQLSRGRPEEALGEFQAALAVSPDDAQALTNYGAALYSLGDTGQASAVFRRALESDPCHFDARNNLILIERRLGRTDRMLALTHPPSNCRYTHPQRAALEAASPHFSPPDGRSTR